MIIPHTSTDQREHQVATLCSAMGFRCRSSLGEAVYSSGVKVSGPSFRTLWALFWRSVVLLPVASVWALLLCRAWLGLFTCPLAAGIFLLNSEWWRAIVCAALWFMSFIFVRWFWRRQRSDSHHGDLERFHKCCSDAAEPCGKRLFAFWLRLGSFTGVFQPAHSPKPRQKAKIQLPHRYIISVNALKRLHNQLHKVTPVTLLIWNDLGSATDQPSRMLCLDLV